MNIYQVEEKTNGEWEDNRVESEIISENPRMIADWVVEKILDDDFFSGGYKSRYSLKIYCWQNGQAHLLFECTAYNKSEALEFLDSLVK